MEGLKISVKILAVFTILTGLLYPLVITGMGMLIFPYEAGGSLVTAGKEVIGSELLGQKFTRPEYFHGRPSASDYDGLGSGGTNYGPSNYGLMQQVLVRGREIRRENDLPNHVKVPSDLVFSSGSGLDPHISLESALIQVPRISCMRKMDSRFIIMHVMKNAKKRYFNVYGDAIVNVFALNRSLDQMERK